MPKITSKILWNKIVDKEKALYGQNKPAIHRGCVSKIMEYEKIDKAIFNYFLTQQYQSDTLSAFKQILPLSDIHNLNEKQGRIDKYVGVSHHVWLTNIHDKPRDIITYKSECLKNNQYKPYFLRTVTHIDDSDNAFIQSIQNLDKGASSSKLPISQDKFYHILWTNFSSEDLTKNSHLTSLRKLYNIDKTSSELPQFIVLNIHDVMNKDINHIKNLASPNTALPLIVKDGLQEMKNDLLSVNEQLSTMFNCKMFASMSDIVRIAAVKNIGGMYFDVDYNLFDQDKVHKEQNKYNLFDLIKHLMLY